MEWIWAQIAELPFDTCLDAFGGTGAVGYRLKQAGKCVVYNDALRFNYLIGKALIENRDVRLSAQEIDALLECRADIPYPDMVQRVFQDIYFTDEENAWIDRTITHIQQLLDPYKAALAFFALAQACIIKRPYNLFHRRNLYIRFADVERSFGNKATWDKPFDAWFRVFAEEANNAVFDNQRANRALNRDAADIAGQYDLVYIDPPYMSGKGTATDYYDFYHFLEGLAHYQEWEQKIDFRSKHRRLKRRKSAWTDRGRIYLAFEALFERFHNSMIVVSYRSDGIPSESELVYLLERYKKQVRVEHYGQYKYVLSKNDKSGEMLLIGT